MAVPISKLKFAWAETFTFYTAASKLFMAGQAGAPMSPTPAWRQRFLRLPPLIRGFQYKRTRNFTARDRVRVGEVDAPGHLAGRPQTLIVDQTHTLIC